MKKKTIILIDGENVSAKNAERIVAITDRFGPVAERRVYHHRKDRYTQRWSEKAKEGGFKDVGLRGGPAKNKIDHRIQEDARRYMKNPDVGMVCVVTSDGGFRCLAEDAAAAGKRLCFIGGKTPSRRLRNTGAQFMRMK